VVGQLILAGKNASNPSAEEEQEEQEEQESATPAAGAVTMDSATRETLLELLAERVRDKNALCRAKVMQQWCLLTSQRAVPLSFLSKLTHVGVSRLKDKSSIVRKYAVQLVTSMLEFNPFSAALKLSECERKLAELKAELGDDDEEQEEADSTSDEPTASAAADDADADADAEGDDETEAEEAVAKPEVVAAEGDEGAVAMLQRKVDFYTAAVSFIKSVHYAMDTVTELLDSKSLTDVQEAINFIVVADAFKVEKSKQGIRKMMLLIWSKDVAIKSAVITAYKTLFLARPIENVPRQQRAAAVARSLIGLTMGANLGELTSLEEIVTDLMAQGLIKDSTVGALWNIFGSQSRQQSEGALSILSMAANADPKVVEANLGMLIALGLKTSDSAAGNRLAKQTCVALQKLEPTGAQLPPSHQLFEHLRSVLLVDDDTVAPGSRAAFDRTWFPAAEQAINTAFVLCTQPEEFCTNVLRDLSSGERLWRNGGKSLSKRGLCRVLFVVGHVAVKHFVFIETTSTQIKKEEDEKENVQKKKEQSRGTPGSPRGLGAELGISNAIDEGEIEAIREMAEREILGERNTIGMYAGLITSLCGLAYRQAGEQPVAASLDEHVRESAVLALCKLMCVGAEYCEPNLQLLFTILNKDTSPRVRANIIIALGDLSFRFPNMLEPWCPHFFARLNDRDLTVRKHTLMALTHLILNDMIKVRAQVSDIALCLEDEAPRMRDLARMFFHELAHKGTNNPIYNYLPDIIGRLSHNADVGTEKFQRIVKFLMSYIEKDKQAEGLVEKLCHRFRGTHELTQWRDIAHCLSVLNYSDRATKKVVELFKCYGDKLADGQVYESFQTIVTKCRKFCKSETKGLLDEFETKLTETHTQAARDLAATQKAERASKTGKTSPMKIKTPSPEEIAEEQESTAMGDKEGEKEANDGEAGEESEEEESGEEDEEEEEEEGSEEEGSEEEGSEEEREEEEEEEEEEIDVSKLKVAELKAHLRKLGLSEAGLKAVLVKRLKKALSEPPAPKAKAKSAPNGKAHAKGRSGKALAEVN
jgi:condensin complex subunit 1